jgi:hypothetical protein
MKIRPVGAEMFYVDGQTGRLTDRHRLTDRRTNVRTDRRADRQAERYDVSNSRFSQFSEFAFEPAGIYTEHSCPKI